MKKLIPALIALMLITFSYDASASDRHHRRSHHYSYGHSFGHHYGGHHFSFGHHYSGHHSDAGWLLGGLVLGSVLSRPRYRYDYSSEPVVRTREIVYVKDRSTNSTKVITGRRLWKDLEGNCFERTVDEDGNELRVQLDPGECNF